MDTALPHPASTGYAAAPPTKAPNWHGLVAWDMLFNSLATGLFLMAALGEFTAPAVFGPLLKAAYPIALVLLLADLACLVLDLGDPLRFHHMLRVFKPHSPMSLGTWCLTAFSLPATIVAVTSLLGSGEGALEWLRKLFVVVGMIPALGVVVYKGVLFSTTAQPGWQDARWLGGHITLSAFVLGSAELLILSLAMGQEPAAALVRPILMFLLILSGIPLGLLLAELYPTLKRIRSGNQTALFAVLSLGVGVLIPLGLLLFAGHPWVLISGAGLVLLAGLIFRWMIVRLPHLITPS
jgi:hypothetical protein